MIKYLFPSLLLMTSCNLDSSIESNEGVRFQTKDINRPDDLSPIEDTINSEKTFSHLITFDETTGSGYQILEDNHLLINQPHIPAVPGIWGFPTKEKAETTALYILDQVEKGNFPPTITKEKLIELDVL